MDSTNNLEVLTQAETASTLALALQTAFQNDDKAELIHVAKVVKAFAKRLMPEFEPLLFYARAIAKWAGGDIAGAIYEFRSLKKARLIYRAEYYSVNLGKLRGCVKIIDVLLDMPSEVFARFIGYSSGGDHFSTFRTTITDAEILKTSLQELGFTVKTYADVRGYIDKQVTADIVAILEGEYDIGWSRNPDGSFDMICDVGGVSERYDPTELIQSILQQYALNKTLAQHDTSEQDY